MMARRVAAALAAVMLAGSPAWAGFDVEIGAEGAYSYAGGCTATGSIMGNGTTARTVPLCDDASSGTFFLRYFTRVPAAGAPVFTVQAIRFVNTTEPGATSATSWIVECTAMVAGALGNDAVSFGDDATVAVDMDATATCADIGETCISGASAATNIHNDSTAADCAADSTCHNADMICKVTYDGTAANTDVDVAVSSLKITVGP